MNAPATNGTEESPRQAIERLHGRIDENGSLPARVAAIVEHLQEQWERGRPVIATVGAVPAFDAMLAFQGTTTFGGDEPRRMVPRQVPAESPRDTERPITAESVMAAEQILRDAEAEAEFEMDFRRFTLKRDGVGLARGCQFGELAHVEWPNGERESDWWRVDQIEGIARDVGAKLEWLDP